MLGIRTKLSFLIIVTSLLLLFSANVVLADDVSMIYDITGAYFDSDDKLVVDLQYHGTDDTQKATLIVAAYLEDDYLVDFKTFEITGATISGLDYKKTDGHILKLFIWDNMNIITPLSNVGSVGDIPIVTEKPTTPPTDDYGVITTNEDGSITLTFGDKSIIQGTGDVKTGSDGMKVTDNLKATGDPKKAILYLPSVDDLSAYNTVNVVMGYGDKDGNTVDYKLLVGGTEVVSDTGVYSGYNIWSAEDHIYDVGPITASGLVALEITINPAASYAGNYFSVTFSNNADAPTAKPTATPGPTIDPNRPTATPEPGTVISVDKDGTGDYTTITEALNSITVSPKSEDERVTITVMEGVYREQIVIDKPFITLKKSNDANGPVNVTWYYAVSYCYDNCGTNGLYDANVDWSDPRTWNGYNDEDAAVTTYKTGDKVSKISYYGKDGKLYQNQSVQGEYLGGPDQWGPTIIAKRYSDDFITEGIYYSNSFNMYVCQEELDAHVIPGAGNTNPSRQILSACPDMEDTPEIVVSSFDPNKTYSPGESAYLVRAYAVRVAGTEKDTISYKERAAAMNLRDNSRVIVKNCQVRGSQDTLYAGGSTSYFEDCDIYGGTDYIFGGAASVFNNCDLYFQGSPDNDGGGVITANSTGSTNPYGYLFLNCTIKNARSNTNNGTLGRPWGGKGGPQVTYYNCKIEKNGKGASCISDAAWQGMGCLPEEARFYEYGTTYTDESLVDLSKRVKNTVAPFGSVVDEWQILEFNPRNYLSGWDPMNFGEEYLTDVDTAIADININIPSGTEREFELPTAPDGITFMWASQSPNAVVTEDGTKIKVMRPAFGEADINTEVILYAVDNENGYGDNKVIPVLISATTDQENVYTARINIEEEVYSNSNTKFAIKFLSDGALIKDDSIIVNAKEKTTTVDILVPVGTFDVQIDCASYTISTPVDGKIKITGEKGDVVNVDVFAQKIVDETVALDFSYESGLKTAMESYDIIALAKEAGASASIDTSDVITINYTLDVPSALSTFGYIDLLYGEPSEICNTSGVNSRFILSKLNSNWNQIDMVDSAQSFSGSSTGPDQALNICGKFNYTALNKLKIALDYKEKTMSVSGSGASGLASFNLETFPKEYAKGKLNLAIYPTDTTALNNFAIKDMTVTYKKIVTEDPEDDKNETLLKFPATVFIEGNLCTDSATYTFADGVSDSIKTLFGDTSDPAIISKEFTATYKNYIGKVGDSKSSNPYGANVNMPAGKYTLYVLGAANNSEINMILSDGVNDNVTARADAGSAVAFDQTGKLILHTLNFETEFDMSNAKLELSSTTTTWLPDLYGFIVVADNLLSE